MADQLAQVGGLVGLARAQHRIGHRQRREALVDDPRERPDVGPPLVLAVSEVVVLQEAFAGLVIVAIAGNAIENFAGILLAAKGQSDLAISVVKNSVAQIAVFLFPLLVLVSQWFETPMTFAMAPVYIASLALTAIIVWQVTGDGAAARWEGAALVAFYIILAAVAFYE